MTIKEIQAIIKEKIPKGLIVPEHTENGHFYRHTGTGELYASVTTKGGILESGPHLKKWAAREAVKHIDCNLDKLTEETKEAIYNAAILAHQNQFEDAGNIGTRGHNIVDKYLVKWIDSGKRSKDIRIFIKEDDSRLYAIARSAEMFCVDFDVIPVASELLVASTKHKFAGTLDSLMMINGKLSLVDWKTSNSIDKPEYAMQVSAYWWALYEMTGLRPKNIYIVRLDKKVAKYEVMKVAHRPSAFKAHLCSGKIYDWLNNGEPKLLPYYPKTRIKLWK